LRLLRDVSGDELARALGDLGYRMTRQTGSHLRLTTLAEAPSETIGRVVVT
jgi:predicted RNA binding protein YcfA (HicA-like mRNA interferase family)